MTKRKAPTSQYSVLKEKDKYINFNVPIEGTNNFLLIVSSLTSNYMRITAAKYTKLTIDRKKWR